MELHLRLPEDLARTAGLDGTDASEQAKLLMLLELYREGRLSLGKLAEVLKLSQADLLGVMRAHNTYLNYSSDDLAEDRQALP